MMMQKACWNQENNSDEVKNDFKFMELQVIHYNTEESRKSKTTQRISLEWSAFGE